MGLFTTFLCLSMPYYNPLTEYSLVGTEKIILSSNSQFKI